MERMMGLHGITIIVVSVLSLVSGSYDDRPVFPVLPFRPPGHRQYHMGRNPPILPGIRGIPMLPRLSLPFPMRPGIFPVIARPGPWLPAPPRPFGQLPPKMIRITSQLPVSGGMKGLPLKRHPLFGKGTLGMSSIPFHNRFQHNSMKRFPPLRPMPFPRKIDDDSFFGRNFDNEISREHYKDNFEERFENLFDEKEDNLFANRRPILIRQGSIGRPHARTGAPPGRILPPFRLANRDDRDGFPLLNSMFSNQNIQSFGSAGVGFGAADISGWPQDERHIKETRPFIDSKPDLTDTRFPGPSGAVGVGLGGIQRVSSDLPFLNRNFGMGERDDFFNDVDDGNGKVFFNTPSHAVGISASMAGSEIDDGFMKHDEKERDMDLLNTDIRSVDDLIAHAGPVFGSDGFENIKESSGDSVGDDRLLPEIDLTWKDRAGQSAGPIAGLELLGRSQWDDVINELATVGSQQQVLKSDEQLAVFPVNPHSNEPVHHRTPNFDILPPIGPIPDEDRFSGLGSDAFSVLGIDPNTVTMLSETGNHRALEVIDQPPSTSSLTPEVPPPIPLPDGTISVAGTPSKRVQSSSSAATGVGPKIPPTTRSGFVDESIAALGTLLAAKEVLDEVGN